MNDNGECGCGRIHEERRSIGKHPIIEWKRYQHERADEQQLREWWRKYPKANPAVVTGTISNVLVLDHDEVIETASHATLAAKSGSGGLHLFYQLDGKGYPSKNRVAEKLDVKCEAGYVILPPSIHQSGGHYEWLNNLPIAKITPLVEALFVNQLAVRSGTGVVHYEGTRDDTTVIEIGRLFARGLGPQEVWEEIQRYNQEWNFPPLSLQQLKEKVVSIWKSEGPKRLEQRNKKQPEPPSSRLVFRTTGEMLDRYGGREQTWIVNKWLPSNTCCIVSAPPETYKTWVMMDLAISISTGRPFLGRYPVERTGRVLIVQQEDNYEFIMDRLMQLSDAGEIDEETFKLYQEPDIHWLDGKNLTIDNEDSMNQLEAFIVEKRPLVAIIDPMYAFIPLADDYGAGAAKLINSRLKRLRDMYGVTFILVHHTSRSAVRSEASGGRKRDSMWGSQFLNAALETGWHLRCKEEGGKVLDIYRHSKMGGHQPEVQVRWLIDDERATMYVLEDP